MDRHKEALTVMLAPEGQLLIAVHGIAGDIDVQRHRQRWSRIARPVNAYHFGRYLGKMTRG
jgi:hypothetical protein